MAKVYGQATKERKEEELSHVSPHQVSATRFSEKGEKWEKIEARRLVSSFQKYEYEPSIRARATTPRHKGPRPFLPTAVPTGGRIPRFPFGSIRLANFCAGTPYGHGRISASQHSRACVLCSVRRRRLRACCIARFPTEKKKNIPGRSRSRTPFGHERARWYPRGSPVGRALHVVIMWSIEAECIRQGLRLRRTRYQAMRSGNPRKSDASR